MEIYDNAYVFADGALLSENTSVKIDYIGDDKPVSTLGKAYAGVEPAPRQMRVTLSEALPSKMSEAKLIQAWLNSKTVELKIQLGGSGESLTSKGSWQPPSVETGVGKPASLGLVFVGEAVAFV